MRKLISLLLAVVMVMGLATVAFAEEAPADQNYEAIADIAELPESVTLAAGQSANFNVYGGPMGPASALAGGAVAVTSDSEGTLTYQYPQPLALDGGVYTAQQTIPGMAGFMGVQFTVTNSGSAEATYSIAFLSAPGTAGNPQAIQAVDDIMFAQNADAQFTYYYKYTAGETPEILTIDGVEVTYGDTANIVPNIAMESESGANAQNGGEDSVSIGLYAGETVNISVTLIQADETSANWTYWVEATFDASAVEAPAGAKVNPIEVDAAGDYVVEGDEVWYAVNSRLAGYIIAVQGDNASLVIGEDTINAVDGLATAVLNGDGATIPVLVSNATDMIIMPAPIEISAAGDYTADVAAGAEVELAVNSKLAGAVLTVEGKDAYILIGTTKYQAVDGVATAVLDGTGATIAVKVGNAGTAAAQYKLNIAYAPTAINAVGDYKVTLAPGAEAEYVVNSKLDGAVVTVKGEGAYLIVDGKKIEGKDGVVTATLTAKAATISLIVGNAGKTTGEWTINVALSDNPQTGDLGMIAAVAVMAMSAIGGTAVIAKKKEN